MATKKKSAPALREALQGYDKHPVYGLLDFYEALAQSILTDRGAPSDLDSLMQIDAPDQNIRKFIDVLWRAERVRESIKQNDPEGAAFFMFRMAVAVDRAKLSLSGEHRKGFIKDRRWLEVAIRQAIHDRPSASRSQLWGHFRANYGLGRGLEVKGCRFSGKVEWVANADKNKESLFYFDDDKVTEDSINRDTFDKAVSKIRK
jgi:hypothetical protein